MASRRRPRPVPRRGGKRELERLIAKPGPVKRMHEKAAEHLVKLVTKHFNENNLWEQDLRDYHRARKITKDILREPSFPTCLQLHKKSIRKRMTKIAMQLAKDRHRKRQLRRQPDQSSEESASESEAESEDDEPEPTSMETEEDVDDLPTSPAQEELSVQILDPSQEQEHAWIGLLTQYLQTRRAQLEKGRKPVSSDPALDKDTDGSIFEGFSDGD